jgi:hypothetical protein
MYAYADVLGAQYTFDVVGGIAQGWFRVPSKNSDMCGIVDDLHWQRFRGQRLKGTQTGEKLELLHFWLAIHKGTDYESRASAQVLNYLGALKRSKWIWERDRLDTLGAEWRSKLGEREFKYWTFFNVEWLVVR